MLCGAISKAAVEQLGRALRLELAGYGASTDSHHLTATFVRTLAPYLLAQIRAAIDQEKK